VQHHGGFFGMQQAIVEAKAPLSQSLSDFLAKLTEPALRRVPEQLARHIHFLIKLI
jgi:hypothetical protein